MVKKVVMVLLTLVIVSFFYYPFDAFFLPQGNNTKKVLGALGIILCLVQCVIRREFRLPKSYVSIFILSGVVSLVAMFAMTFNGTIDDAYAGYYMSMAVWLSAAFVVCSMIKWTHGEINVELLCNYLIAISVIQCFLALAIDNNEVLKTFVDTKIQRGHEMMDELKRLYGIGCGLDTAGIHFSLCLIMIAFIVKRSAEKIKSVGLLLYFFSYVVIVVVGSMIARTTYVGVVLSIAFVVLDQDYTHMTINKTTMKTIGLLSLTIILGIIVFVIGYRTDPGIRHWLRFAFEGFFNLFERGEYSVASTETLETMYVFPDALKTWIVGDGYFSNPYWSDPYYLWQGQNRRGFYMGTDVGYLRFIFYFGMIGLVAFSIFFVDCARQTYKLLPRYGMLILFTLLAGFAVWLKVATDVFFQFALFLCVGNMMARKTAQEKDE